MIRARLSDFEGPLPRRIVLTGAPCAGKSSVIRTLQDTRSDIQVLPELASFLIKDCGFMPQRSDCEGLFERTVYLWQVAAEEAATVTAMCQNKTTVVFDRGRLDPAAFMVDKIDGFLSIVPANFDEELAQYNKVIQLGLAPEQVFQAMRTNNPARVHDYQDSLRYDAALRDVWRHHPNYVYINDRPTWAEKLEAVMREIG